MIYYGVTDMLLKNIINHVKESKKQKIKKSLIDGDPDLQNKNQFYSIRFVQAYKKSIR